MVDSALSVVEVRAPIWALVSLAVATAARLVVVRPPSCVADRASSCEVLRAATCAVVSALSAVEVNTPMTVEVTPASAEWSAPEDWWTSVR